MPSVSPNESASQPIIVQRRTARSHASSRCPVISAAIPERAWIVIATSPM